MRAPRGKRWMARDYRRLVEEAPTGVYLIVHEARVIDANATFSRMLGYSPNELRGRDWRELIHPAEMRTARKRSRDLWRGRTDCCEAEVRYLHRDGHAVWARMRASLIRSAQGRPLHSVVRVEDLTERKQTKQALEESEQRFRIMGDGCPTLLWVTDASGETQFINRAYRDFFGIGGEDGCRRKWPLLIHEDDRIQYVGAFDRAVREHAPLETEARVRAANGEWRWLFSRAEPRFSTSGEYLGHVGLSLDTTERKVAEEALRRSEEKFRALAENIREVFWMTDASGRELEYVSPTYEQTWGRPCEQLYADPMSWTNAIHPEDRVRAEAGLARQLAGERTDNEYRIVLPSGRTRWIRDRAFPIRDDAGKVIRITGVAEDVTEARLSEMKLKQQALHDHLTGLPNRSFLTRKIERAIRELPPGQSGAVFFIDLDEFRLVNEAMGHFAGDTVLKEVARRLGGACPPAATLARFGGDEFVIVAAGFEERERIAVVGQALLKSLEEPFEVCGHEIFLGASVGVSVFPENGTDRHTLKRSADLAMHEAKRAGKNQMRFFTPELAELVQERLELQTRLRRALDNSELRLQFQPQFAVGRPQPVRFEALLRWHPASGPAIPPLKFIPLAEENGSIVAIGAWVLREACERCAAWQSGSLAGTGVAVNVSARQFADTGFLQKVASTLRQTGLRPDLLEIELTESVLMHDLKAASATLSELRQMGVTVALDDFGTGYSSLSYIQNLALDALKIDRSLLTHSESHPQGVAVLRCLLDMAHVLGLRVVAEGVETPAQLDLLAGLGCNEIQGFLLGKPAFDVDCYFGPGFSGAASDAPELRNGDAGEIQYPYDLSLAVLPAGGELAGGLQDSR